MVTKSFWESILLIINYMAKIMDFKMRDASYIAFHSIKEYLYFYLLENKSYDNA